MHAIAGTGMVVNMDDGKYEIHKSLDQLSKENRERAEKALMRENLKQFGKLREETKTQKLELEELQSLRGKAKKQEVELSDAKEDMALLEAKNKVLEMEPHKTRRDERRRLRR